MTRTAGGPGKAACIWRAIGQFGGMVLPQTTVSLSPEQVAELNTRLSEMRHNINNYLALIVAASELIRRKPEMIPRMIDTVSQQPEKIIADIQKFSAEFESALGIGR